jgi:quercetin dioxygenase-like cupin family protein
MPDIEYFIDPEVCPEREIFPGVNIHTMAGRQMMLSVVDLQPNSVVELHHHHHEQIGILLEGELIFTIGGQQRTLRPGQMWRIPGDVEHKAIAGPQGAKALDVFSPIREEYL